MGQKTFSLASGIIFLLIALLHALRLYYGWSAAIGGWIVPLWLSWIALVVAAYLAYRGLGFSRRR